jgi:hypothetical protein
MYDSVTLTPTYFGYTTNDGAIEIVGTRGGGYSIRPARDQARPFTMVYSLEDAIKFILGARQLMRPVEDDVDEGFPLR